MRPGNKRRPAVMGWLVAAALVVLAALSAGCSTTRYYERARLADHAMKLDANPRLVFILNKTQAAREGSFGGFGGAAAGGCGCQ